MTDNSERSRKNFIHLIASNKDHVFQYEGFCKIVINHLQSLLFVEPFYEEFKLISAMFKWKFWAQKNILFVFADFNFKDFILVFNNEFRCKKVYDLIYRKRAKDEITNEQIYERILKPICNQIIRISNLRISELLMKWMNKLEKQDKQMFIKMMKDNEIYDLIFPNVESAKENVGDMDNKSENKVRRKRKFSHVVTSANSKGKDLINDDSRSVKTQKMLSVNFVKSDREFKLVKLNGNVKFVKRLLMFNSDDKKSCYEYRQNYFMPFIYTCTECRKMGKNVYAKIENDFLLLEDNKHVCSKLQYSAEKYYDLQIIKKPDYEILENCNTKNGKVLIVFNPNDRNQCHEYRGRKCIKTFRCCRCDLKAVVYNISMENEYVETIKNHDCPFRPYDPEKFYKFKNFVLSPNFKIQTKVVGEIEKKTLIIFDKNDKSKCYIYGFCTAQKLFRCKNCLKQGLTVSAKLHQNSEGEDYIVLSNIKHVCDSVKYFPQNEYIILRQPDFIFMEENLTGTPKLFIFDSKNKNLCYVFSPVERNCNRFRCLGCPNIADKKKPDGNSNGVVIYVSLCKDENGEYYVQMKNQKHLCQPRRFEPEKYEIKKAKIFDKYFFYRKKKYPKSINVAILHPNDSTLCYSFLYEKSNNRFVCSNCIKLKKCYHISLPKMNENEKEYFIHDQSKHFCEPIKISSIQTSKFQNIQKCEFTFNKKSKKKEMKIDEKRILKLPNFEFRPNQKGNPEGKLVIFDSKDKSLCYEYYYLAARKLFVCTKCQKKNHCVTAKVHFDKEKNENFIEISEIEHICEPIKDEFKDKIIHASDFMVTNRNDETKPTKIIVFTSESKEFYCEFTYCVSKRSFECYACLKLKKYVGVKLITKKIGEEYLLKTKKEHVCEPKKYEPPKIIPESLFELYKNKKGEEDKKLIVFTSEKKDFVHEYYWDLNLYRCSKCIYQNKSVTAKLLEKENETWVELSKVEHICAPQKYDRKKYKK